MARRRMYCPNRLRLAVLPFSLPDCEGPRYFMAWVRVYELRATT